MGTASRLIHSVFERAPGPIPMAAYMLRERFRASADEKTWIQKQLKTLADIGNPRVIAQGPFKGGKYIHRSSCSTLVPKLLGTYELELYPMVEELCNINADVVVDVGTAEGYYAIGMARRNPRARVFCYEIDQNARYLLNWMARLNHVTSQLTIRSFCTPDSLNSALENSRCPIIICDCEGFEDELLLPDKAPNLKRAYMLVELHDMYKAGVTDRIRQRFENTHTIQEIFNRPRTIQDLPPGLNLSPELAERALEERHEKQNWFYLKPKLA